MEELEHSLPEEQCAQQVSTTIKEILEHLQAEIFHTQHRYQEYADSKRRPAPAFKVGGKVWFNPQNVSMQRPSHKLDHCKLGPYEIIKVVSPYAYKLQFPATVQYHCHGAWLPRVARRVTQWLVTCVM